MKLIAQKDGNKNNEATHGNKPMTASESYTPTMEATPSKQC